MTYPATNLNEAVGLIVPDSNALHDIINGDADSTVITPEGREVPTVLKAMVDSLLFKDPILWEEGALEQDPLQLRTFTDGLIYWAPTAQSANPVAMGVSPVGDSNWKISPIIKSHNSLTDRDEAGAHPASAIALSNGLSVEDGLRQKGLRLLAITERESLSGNTLVGDRVYWEGYYEQSDGGGNWGVVHDSPHVEDGLEHFTISGTLHIKANLRGTINPMMAGLFGGATDIAKLQNLLNKSQGKVKFGREVTYESAGQLDINTSNTFIALNGATLNLECALGQAGVYDKGNRNEISGGYIHVNYLPGAGGNGHAGACVTVGTQSTGAGRHGWKYHNLTLSTNRTDAGGHISVIGECYNGSIRKITIPDNEVCRNLIGIEWGGTPAMGTGHPHDITISQINVGKITTPTYGASGYAYVVWCSSAFNISVSSVYAKEAYGLMMCIAGDNANTYAPSDYKELVGMGCSIKNSAISACYGYALRAVGKGFNTTGTIPCNLRADMVVAVGKKVGSNNNFALQTEFTKGVHLTNFEFKGVWAAGTTTGSNVDNLIIENGVVTGCELYGSSVGSGAIKSLRPTIRRVHYYKNNTLGGVGSGTSAVVVNTSDDAVVEFCSFGKEAEEETQRYSIFTSATALRPKVLHNHTYTNDNPIIDPYLLASSTVYEINSTKDF